MAFSSSPIATRKMTVKPLSRRDANRLVSRKLDGPLPFGRQVWLNFHLLVCDTCRRFARQLDYPRLAMRRYRS
jgi:hypothetical protein